MVNANYFFFDSINPQIPATRIATEEMKINHTPMLFEIVIPLVVTISRNDQKTQAAPTARTQMCLFIVAKKNVARTKIKKNSQ